MKYIFFALCFSMLCGSSNEWVTSHSEREFPMKQMLISAVSGISIRMLMLLAKNIIDEEYAYYKLKKNAIKIKKNNSSKNNSSYELFGFVKEKNILEYYINILVNKLPSYNGVLLYGKPGNRKSTLINYISDQASVPVIEIKIAAILGAQKQLVIRLLDDIFELAKQYTPCVIVFEEVDLMIKNREKNLTTDENILLAYFLDMINLILAQKSPIVLLAATNYKDSLDEAFLRQGRFGDHIFIDYPTRDDIKDIIENKLIFYPIKEVSQFINFYDIPQLLSNKKYTRAKVIDYIRRLNHLIVFWGLGTPYVGKINKELAIKKINDKLSRNDNQKLFEQFLEKFHKNMQIIK